MPTPLSPGPRPRRRAVLLATAATVAAVLAACAQPLHDAAWDDLVTARQQDAIDRGWVPEWLPEAATDLVEVDRPSTGAVVLRATLDDDVAIDACTPSDDLADRPEDLVPDADPAWEPDSQGLRLACDDGWSAVRADNTIWAWATAPETPS